MDIYELIASEHRTAYDLFRQIEATSRYAARTREELFSQLAFELRVHAQAEKAVVYTTLRQHRNFEGQILDAADDHARIEMELRLLEAAPKYGDEWRARFDLLREVVDRHHAEEEVVILEQARRLLGRLEAEDLAVWMGVARANFSRMLATSAARPRVRVLGRRIVPAGQVLGGLSRVPLSP